MRFCLKSKSNEKLVKGSNWTFTILISKVANPQIMVDYLLIFLVGCLYKVLAKNLMNMFKSVIDKVVNEFNRLL